MVLVLCKTADMHQFEHDFAPKVHEFAHPKPAPSSLVGIWNSFVFVSGFQSW